MKIALKLSSLCIGLVVGSVLWPQFAIAKTATEIGQLAKSVTVLIQGPDTGSGVVIRQEGSNYTVLTARHVLDAAGNYEVVAPSGQKYAVTPQSIRKLPGLDLALFQFKSPEKQSVATVGNSNSLQEGMPVYVTGFPGQGSTINALAYNFTEGQLTARSSKPQEGGYALVYTNKTLPGMSGGPVFDQEAQLIGIHGAADGQSQTLEKLNSRVYVKTGFNLGIPINTFLSTTDSKGPQGKTLALANQPKLEENSRPGNLKFQSAPNASSTTRSTPAKSPAKVAANYAGSGSGDYFLSALNQYIKGDLAAAMLSCNKALRLNPKFAGAYSLRGNINYINQDYTGALSDFNQAAQFDTRLASAYMGRGLTQSALSNPEAAIADYTQAIQLSPDVLAYYNRGVVQLNLGNQAAALQDLQKSADLALAEGNQTDYDRAKEALTIAGRNCQQSIRKICDR
jgi:serine protease Do